ncbi:MAG TPA: biotin/lipoyl-binding protein, partial [bacterium]|nr:biotin/lipoyl-binding protein [bacterium]
REKYPVSYGTTLFVKDGDRVKEGQVLAEWDPYNTPIIAETEGFVKYDDIDNGVTVREELDAQTGLSKIVVINSRDPKKLPKIMITDAAKKKAKKIDRGEALYHLPVNAYIEVKDGEEITAGKIVAKVPREARKTKDITGGLPRISDLFEARRPKTPAIVSEIDGYITISTETKGAKNKTMITVTPEQGEQRAYLVPKEKHINVHDGDFVEAGESLIDGSIDPHDVLRIKAETEVAKFLVQEVQKVYKLQGVPINDKHIEVIVRQMLRKVRIVDPRDTAFMKGELIEKEILEAANLKVENEGKEPARWETALLGITKASLNTESFISAASFQETTKVLTNASVERKVDTLRGLKENIIIGKRIPAGTGFPKYHEAHYEVVVLDQANETPDEQER